MTFRYMGALSVQIDTGRMQPNALNNRLVQEGFLGFCVTSCRKSKVHQLPIRINRAPKLTPFSAYSQVGFVNVPI